MQADFAIITMRQDEYKALANRFPPTASRAASGRHYGINQIQTKDGKDRTVALARCDVQGPQPAQQLANDMIKDLSPSLLLVVGIAGGVPDTDFTLGDVVISSCIHDFGISAYKPGKIEWDRRGGIHLYVSEIIASLPLYEAQLQGWNTADSLGVSRPTLDITDFGTFDSTKMTPQDKQRIFDGTPPEFWQQKILDMLKSYFDDRLQLSDPLFIDGSIGSSGSLVRDTAILIQWLQNARSIRAVEMEVGGVFQAAQQLHQHYPVIAIRGISDIIGLKRDYRWTPYACHSAAAFTYALLTSHSQLFENLQMPSSKLHSSLPDKSTSYLNMDTKFVVGLDLGDGESSIAFISVEDKIEPQIFEPESGERSIITALARTNKDTFIGEEALFHEDVIELALNFKDKPSDSRQSAWRTRSPHLRSFAEELYRCFAEAQPKVAANAQVYIGHPSSWTEEDKKRYLELFPPPPYGAIPAIKLVPESRSALIQVRDYHHISEDQLDSVLVIDIGSSTIDFTSVEQLKPKEILVGDKLGTRLIDQAVFDWVKEKYSHLSTIENMKSREKAYLLYLCRKAKEQYFTNHRFYPQTKDPSFERIVKDCWGLLQLQDADVESILARPVEGFPNGWEAAFRDLLVLAQEDYGQRYGKVLAPKVILLTGGGSYMSFTIEICQEAFAPALVTLDSDPSHSVAKGLAGFGRWRYRVDQFHKAIDDFLQSDRLEKEIHKRIDPFAEAVGVFFSKAFLDGALRPMMHELREGVLRSDEIGDYGTYVNQRLTQWLKTPEGLQAQQKVTGDFIEDLNLYISTETDDICERFEIEKGSLRLNLSLSAESLFDFKQLRGSVGAFGNFVDKLGELVIKVADHTIPVYVRKLIPTELVDMFLNLELEGREIFAPLVMSSYVSLPEVASRFKHSVVSEVREQLKKQLKERAGKVEILLQ